MMQKPLTCISPISSSCAGRCASSFQMRISTPSKGLPMLSTVISTGSPYTDMQTMGEHSVWPYTDR